MFSFFAFIFGLIVGSFLNVVILRLKNGERFNAARSYCPHCRGQLAWYDNMPVVSFLALRGHCRYCRKPISWQYPLVELACGLLWLGAYLKFGAPALLAGTSFLPALTFGLFGSVLLTLFVFDFRWYILPDEVTLPGLGLALLFNILAGYDWHLLVVLAAVGSAWFWIQHAISRGRWVGAGDIRLGAMVGAMVGSWPGLLVAFMLTYLGGSLVGLGLLATGRKHWQSQLPLGTFMTVATVITLLWGLPLWQWYLGFLW